jgi:hypothetical protein
MMFGWFKGRQGQAGDWATGPAPDNVVLIVAKYGQQFTGGDGHAIQFPPEVAFAWCRPNAPWINFATGHPMTWAPDLWMRLPDLPDLERPSLASEKPRAQKGALGI